MSNALNRAVECWRSNKVPIVAEAKKMALAFLAEVSADYLAGPAFALTICRRILNEFEDRMCTLAPDEVMDGESMLPMVFRCNCKDALKQSWRSHEFCLEIKQLKDGQAQIGVWAMNEKYRKKYHQKIKRLSHSHLG